MSEINSRERIQQSAHSLFMQYGIRSVSMDDIAASLGMSKKTVYQFFSDKDELVEAVVGDEILQSEQCCNADRVRSKNAVDEIFLTMDLVEDIFSNMNPAVIFDLQKYHPTAFKKFEKHKNDYIFNVIKENLERGIAEELYRPDINIEIMARFRIESMMLVFHPSFYTKSKTSLAEVEQQVLEHFLYGLVTAKGHKLCEKYKEERFKKLNKNAASKVK